MSQRRCDECGMTVTRGQPDPCLGQLPGVAFACCGHGNRDERQAYIRFENGVTIRARGTAGSFDIDDVTRHYHIDGHGYPNQGPPPWS